MCVCHTLYVLAYVCVCVCMCVYMYVCVCVYIPTIIYNMHNILYYERYNYIVQCKGNLSMITLYAVYIYTLHIILFSKL